MIYICQITGKVPVIQTKILGARGYTFPEEEK